MSRPVHLQVNQTGAWRTALTFDLDKANVNHVKDVAETLVELVDFDGPTKLRLATADGHQRALCRWDSEKGWQDA